MRRLAALLLLGLPLFAQLPQGTSRVTFQEMRDAYFFAATADGAFWAASLVDDDLQRFAPTARKSSISRGSGAARAA